MIRVGRDAIDFPPLGARRRAQTGPPLPQAVDSLGFRPGGGLKSHGFHERTGALVRVLSSLWGRIAGAIGAIRPLVLAGACVPHMWHGFSLATPLN